MLGGHKAKSWCEALRQGHVGRHKARSWCEDLRRSQDGRTHGQVMLGESQREEELWKQQVSICRIDVILENASGCLHHRLCPLWFRFYPLRGCLLDQRKSLWWERSGLLLCALETYIFSKWALGAENLEQVSFLQVDKITHLSTRQKGSLPVMTLSNSYVSWACTTRCIRVSKQVNKYITWDKELTGSKTSLRVYNRLASRGEIYFHGERPESLRRS